jgi:hypothetical protein
LPARPSGLEPPTSRVTGECSNQLSYGRIPINLPENRKKTNVSAGGIFPYRYGTGFTFSHLLRFATESQKYVHVRGISPYRRSTVFASRFALRTSELTRHAQTFRFLHAKPAGALLAVSDKLKFGCRREESNLRPWAYESHALTD